MSAPDHDQTITPKGLHSRPRTLEHEAPTWEGDPSALLSAVQRLAGNEGLRRLLAQRQLTLQREGGSEADDAREAGRRDRAARREALDKRRQVAAGRRADQEARAAARAQGGQPPAAGPVAAAGPAPPVAGPAPAGGGGDSMAAKLAKWAEFQNKRAAEQAAPAPGAWAATGTPKAKPPLPDQAVVAQQTGDLLTKLRKVAKPVVDQRLYTNSQDKKTFLLFRENNVLTQELSSISMRHREGTTTPAQYEAAKTAWLAKLAAYEKKVAAYQPPQPVYVPTTGKSAAEMDEDAIRQRKREGRWAERADRRG